MVELIGTINRNPDNVDLIRNRNFGVVGVWEFREALYKAAKEVATYRQHQINHKPDEVLAQAVKTKGIDLENNRK
ncbi:hypothetical protein [Spirosoma pollinicola]|uniref:Uncharacterized protein n=1 Tax=Spirosoma pollinicola TaxID=2057025 RepID=A0A2K8ZA40_9BACT|nr:hypothetical protein [Spirosoma pollinicola]AUD06736.1 hypothetical protein CWM47_35775 [Spirosoma pollinicola]